MAAPTPAAVAFAAGLNDRFSQFHRYEATGGQKYDRIVAHDLHGVGGGVHAFVDRSTGAVLKADSYRRPAPGVRYPDVATALEHADWSGSYLYAR